ncbi:MAG: tetratricopeptide repeat protein [Lachnospiraceae bacterium]|nr:tetratricopeptide repeat protein [Lachnospiraceae bacterium]
MDKYEYSLKLDQLKALCLEGKYEEAAEIADSINWNKVKNVNALVKAGEIYEKVGRFDDSREILLNAYDRSPIGRTIIYRLAEVAIAMGDFEGAQEYYDEFVDIAPHDNQRYVLQYNIRKAQNATPRELIPILEDLKEQEYTEEWAFELACLYHKTGEVEKCIDSCDELILWFGDGPYVERALELKMLYQPLTKAQEEKYRRFRHEKEGKTVIGAEEMERAGEYVHETVAIPQITLNPSRFNTTNLQEEIAKGMQQIMEATEKETVVGTMDSIKKIVEDIPYLNLPIEEPVVEEVQHIETDEEIDGSLKINFQELLGEEYDGQMSLVMNEKARLEQQITGQMTIAEVLEEWEKTKRAAETALQEAEQRKLDSAKARALQEAEGIMERLNTVLPKIEAGVTPQEMLEEQYIQKANAILDEEIQRLSTENDRLAAEIAAEVRLGQTIRMEDDDLEQIKAAVADLIQDDEDVPMAVPETTDEPIEEVIEEDTEELIPEPIVELEEDSQEETMPEIKMNPIVEQKVEESPEEAEPAREEGLTEDQKAIFSYFVPVRGMEAQLCKALEGIMEHEKAHLIIQGSEGCGKTMLATSIIRVLQKECGHPNGKVGKIYAEALNKKDIQQLLKKVAGGCLIIEKAGEINRQTAVALSLLLEQDTSGTLVIIEDTAAGIEKALSVDDSFAKRFTETVTVPLFKVEDFVTFASAYANELGYVIDEMAVLALHNRITSIEKLDQATKLEEIKEIIDGAIDCEAHSGLRKFIGILTANRYTDDEKIVLREKDFE